MSELTALANSQISIGDACRMAGMDVSFGYGNRKTHCPFGVIAHPDGGVEAAFRLYEDTNSAYCFACARYWSPVGLLAEIWDCAREEAADRMCREAGITPPTWRDRWEMLTQPDSADTASLAEALKRWCHRIYGPAWADAQFESAFAEPLAACFALLPLVSSGSEAQEWLDGCKLVMGPLLKGGTGGKAAERDSSGGPHHHLPGRGDAGDNAPVSA